MVSCERIFLESLSVQLCASEEIHTVALEGGELCNSL